MSDPFERAAKIRKGELDDEMPDYNELTGWMQRVPITWMPGLLIRVVELCVIRAVFRDTDSLLLTAARVAKRTPLDVLRDNMIEVKQ